MGTGVGVGLVVNQQTVKGLLHPEAGHVNIRSQPNDPFAGVCPFHGNCVEGLCATGALAARAGCLQSDLPNLSDDHDVWGHCAYTLAQLCANLVLVASPEKIVISGGVLERQSLFPRIRAFVQEILNGYVRHPSIISSNIDDYIIPSTWGNNAGLVGAFAIAQQAYNERFSH